jgi:hypothetical protein
MFRRAVQSKPPERSAPSAADRPAVGPLEAERQLRGGWPPHTAIGADRR